MSEYQESKKNQCREEALAEAVGLLTTDRASLPLASRSYVADVRNHLTGSGNPHDHHFASLLDDITIRQWENFYDGLLQKKAASDLKVAYLSGPNPINDLKLLTSLGILPENVWAFESDENTYNTAINNTLKSEFPYLKIFKGNISSLLSLSLIKFDLIYLDFCGPIPSRSNKNLHTLFTILYKHALTSPGILISNAAFPNQNQDDEGWHHLTSLIAYYLYPKSFIESPKGGGFIEGPLSDGKTPEDFRDIVRNNSEFYYGQFLTRLLMDTAGIFAPYQAFSESQQVINKFFNTKNPEELEESLNKFYHFQDDYSGGDVITDPDEYPLLWTIAALNPKRNASDTNYPDAVKTDKKFASFASGFFRQLSINQNDSDFIKNVERMLFFLSESFLSQPFYEKSLKKLSSRKWWREFYQFCDVVMLHQLKDLLVRQIASPYHFNVLKSRRWTYKAKEHQMFVDLSVFDEARYVYDWMPTMDMLENGMDNPDRQLAFRFALDALNKHRRWYNSEFFSGTAIIDQFTEPFEAKELIKRKSL